MKMGEMRKRRIERADKYEDGKERGIERAGKCEYGRDGK